MYIRRSSCCQKADLFIHLRHLLKGFVTIGYIDRSFLHLMPDTLTKLAYQAFQEGKSYFGLAYKAVSTQLTNRFITPSQREAKSLPVELLFPL